VQAFFDYTLSVEGRAKMHENCECIVCQAMKEGLSHDEALEKLRQKETELLAKYKWIVHAHPVEECNPFINAHTHGLMDNFNHLDFQLVAPLPPQSMHSILGNIVNRVKSGERFESGEMVSEIIRDFEIKLVKYTEHDREVLRIILPDKHGELEYEKMVGPLKLQYELENEE
jgi:hypothetical protein